MRKASERQREVFEYLVDQIDETGTMPTYRDIQKALGYRSKNSVDQIMLALKKKGFIEVSVGRYGGIKFID